MSSQQSLWLEFADTYTYSLQPFLNTLIGQTSYLLTVLSVNNLTNNLLYHPVGFGFQTLHHGNEDPESQLEFCEELGSINLFQS